MSATLILINLAGAVAMLLWGLRMVHTGISRALKDRLYHLVQRNIANRFSALLVGIVVTITLQSSTATGLIVSSIAHRGAMTIATGLAIMLGADIGTTLVVQILSFDIGWLSPLMLLTGVIIHHMMTEGSKRQWGRVLIGIGLILLALNLIMTVSIPLRESSLVLQIFSMLEGDWLIALVLMALLTWAVHSSLAMVLLIMVMASSAMISPVMSLVLVLGANLGGTLPALLTNWRKGPKARHVPLGNALFKLAGVVLMLPLISHMPEMMTYLGPAPGHLVVNFHTVFNFAIACLFLPLVGPAAKLVETIQPLENAATDKAEISNLDEDNIDNPGIALASATLETIQMGQLVEDMLRDGLKSIENRDPKLSRDVLKRDDAVDRLHENIKLYVTQVTTQELDKQESLRAANILTFTTDLEHIGDILGHLMMANDKRIASDLSFSDEGFNDIQTMHMRVVDGLKLAIGVFVSNDPKLAEQLLDEKRIVRQMEQDGAKAHMERLGQQRPESINTSALHMDFLRDLKRIHSHIVAIAYPVLNQKKKG